mmetsp:Transcript_38001/g.117423  ORF Transcript_38001/g.117423 Transcript_38001/m.117423 type:complete len:270 (-) Transcript_38001:17-826(-)
MASKSSAPLLGSFVAAIREAASTGAAGPDEPAAVVVTVAGASSAFSFSSLPPAPRTNLRPDVAVRCSWCACSSCRTSGLPSVAKASTSSCRLLRFASRWATSSNSASSSSAALLRSSRSFCSSARDRRVSPMTSSNFSLRLRFESWAASPSSSPRTTGAVGCAPSSDPSSCSICDGCSVSSVRLNLAARFPGPRPSWPCTCAVLRCTLAPAKALAGSASEWIRSSSALRAKADCFLSKAADTAPAACACFFFFACEMSLCCEDTIAPRQ